MEIYSMVFSGKASFKGMVMSNDGKILSNDSKMTGGREKKRQVEIFNEDGATTIYSSITNAARSNECLGTGFMI